MTKLKIKITKEILAQPCICDQIPSTCAFARAVRDIFPEARVGSDSITPFWESADVLRDFPVSLDMRLFIEKFDNTHTNQRINLPEQEFELEIPDWVINRINLDELKPLLENHPNLELV